MQIKFRGNIHSLISVITNSSSEIFAVNDNKTEEYLIELLTPIIERDKKKYGCSGDAGDVFVGMSDFRGEFIIRIDWAFRETSDFIQNILGYENIG